MKLGENIYQNRTERGLSQGGLADALEVSRQSVSKWENGTAIPELDKLIKMSKLFGITLDELVYGKIEEPKPQKTDHPRAAILTIPPARVIIGSSMLLFGMVFFLLSVFWGKQLRLGEEFGELVSLSIVLISLALIATHNHFVLASCSVIYLIYGIVSIKLLHAASMTHYVFMFVASIVILVWFLVWGTHASAEEAKKETSPTQQRHNGK